MAPVNPAELDDFRPVGAAPPPRAAPRPGGSSVNPAELDDFRPVDAAASPPEERPGIIAGTAKAGLAGLISGTQDVGETLGKPATERKREYYEDPITAGDLLSPSTFFPKLTYGLAKSYPMLAGGVLGGIGGTAVGGAPGGLIGGTLGAMGGSALQALGPNLAQAAKETSSPDEAFDLAWKRTGIETAVSGASWALFGGIAPFKNAVKKELASFIGEGTPAAEVAARTAAANKTMGTLGAAGSKDLAIQALGVQPAVSEAGRVASNVSENRPALQGVGDPNNLVADVAGAAVPAIGHAVAERGYHMLRGAPKPAADATTTSPGTSADGESSQTPGADAIQAVLRANQLESAAHNDKTLTPEQRQAALDEARGLREKHSFPGAKKTPPAAAPTVEEPAPEPPAPPAPAAAEPAPAPPAPAAAETPASAPITKVGDGIVGGETLFGWQRISQSDAFDPDAGIALGTVTKEERAQLAAAGLLNERGNLTYSGLQDLFAERDRRAATGQRQEATLTPEGEARLAARRDIRQPIGTNGGGHPIYEDENGVRSYGRDGVRVSEPVQMIPTREGYRTSVDRDRRGDEFKTDEERAPAPDKAGATPPPGVPFMITAEMRRRLAAAGYTAEQVGAMTPAEAWSLLNREAPAPAAEEKPVKVETPADMQKVRARTDPDPSAAEVHDGTAEKGRGDFQGIPFTLETAKGETRTDKHNDPPLWSVPNFPADYGEIERTVGADKEPVDAYFGPNPQSPHAFIIDQIDPATGKFDEHKVLLGFDTSSAAARAYFNAFPDGSGPSRLGDMSDLSVDQLKDWLKNGNTKKAFAPAQEKPAAAPPPKPTPQSAAARGELGSPEAPDVVGLGRLFAAEFAKGRQFASILEARKFAAEHLGGEVTATGRKALDEAIEFGVTLHARDLVQAAEAAGVEPKAIYDALVALYQAQPLLNEKTADSRLRQAYSTPVPIAYLASKMARIGRDSVVYEPTAGNGALLIGANPDHVIANEIDPARREALAATYPAVTEHDAATWLPGAKIYDAVIANPPFGKVEGKRWQTPKYKTQEIDHAIVFKALEAMKDDGASVLIIGGKKLFGGAESEERLRGLYNTAESRAFFKSLFDLYNVVDHFQISGDLYNRQGAAWPIDVLRIEGRGKSALPLPGVRPPRIYRSFEQLRDLVHGYEDGRLGTTGEHPRPDGGPRAPGDGTVRPPDVPGGVPVGPRPSDDTQGGGGSGARGDHDVPAPGPRLPEPAPKPLGDRTPAGGGTGADAAGGEHTGALPVPGEGGERPGATGAGDRGPGDVAEPGGAPGAPRSLDDEVAKALQDALDAAFPKEEPPAVERPAATEAPSGGPRAPRARREKQPEETKAAPPTPNDGERSMDDIVRDLDTLFQRAEDDPNEERTDLNPGVDSQKYSKAQPMFREALRKLGGKDGDDLSGLASKLVSALRDAYNYTRERIAAMMPYLQQFLKDVQNGLVKLSEAVSRRRDNTEAETKYQTHYEPGSEAEPVGTLVPVNMQTAITRSLDKLRERVGNIDDFVAKKLGYSREQVIGTKEKPGVFSAEQVDAIALAIDNLDRGAGFIIGDQTGVGKGRFVAAMMQYAIKQGKAPIFVTQSPGLFADIHRDIADIGRKGFNGLVTNGDLRGDKRVPLGENRFIESPPPAQMKHLLNEIIKTGRLPDGYDALFTTYSQMQFGGDGKRYQRHDALEALARNALIILDESHEAGGTETKKINPETGETIPGRSDFARQLLAQSDGAIYSSATYAKNPHVMSLYFKTDMGLAVDKIEDLAPLIKSGGVPLQQAVANMLTEAGQYVRRERSYDGVEMRMNTVPSDRETAERVSSTLRGIFDIDKRMGDLREAFGEDLAGEGETTGADNAVGDSGISSVNFSSLMHNVIGQSLLALKTQHAVDEAVAAWQRGEKPIVALSNTFGALLDRYVRESKLKPGADLSKLTFNRVFENYLRRTREVTVKDPFDRKKDRRVYIDDDKMRELGFDELIKDYDNLKDEIGKTDLGSMPASPIDHMLDEMRKAGMKVGEITGREQVIENGVLRQRESSAAAKKNTMNDFNSGALDALIINRSGSTGFSLHASEKYRDKRQRNMILLQADPNIDTFMQILGRVHRTGQVVVPKYQLLMTDLPAEKRPAANIMRKLGSLNANTSANRESAVSLDNVVDFMNQYGDEVVGEILHDDPEVADILGMRPTADGGYPEGVAAKATGRLAILPVAQQEEVYARIERNYQDHIETLNRLGQNALEAKALDLDARTTASRPISEDKGVDSPFSKSAILETVSAKRIGKPYTMDETKDRIAQIVGKKDRTELSRRDTADHVMKLRSDMREKGEEYLNTIREQQAEAAATVAALKGALDPNKSPEDNSRALSAVAKAEERVSVLAARLERMQASEQIAQDWLDRTTAGQYVNVTIGTGDRAESFLGATLGVVREGKSKNPFALSSFTAHFAIADGAREIKVPLSKLASGQFQIEPALASEVNRAFDSGQAVGREQRAIVTGNLVAGYHAFGGKGMITVFTDSEGNTRPGILLPRGFDADAALESRPVVLRPDQAITFMERLSEKDAPAFVKSDDGKLTVQRMPDGDYFLKASARGGKPFYLNRDVNKILGGKQFSQRRGSKTWDAEVTAKQLPQILGIYGENLGTRFVAEHERDTAREVAAASGGEEPPQFQRAEEDDEDEPRGQTATPEFKRWFGDSKVVDDSGEPLRVYHGTNGNVEMFDPARASTSSMHATAYLGHFFSAAPEIANSFVPSYDDFRQYPGRRTPKNGGNVIPAFLSIAKPFELPLADFREMVRKGGSEAAQSLREHLESQGFDGIKIPGDPKLLDTYGADEWGADTWIAFHSEQIKSATGNRGTFDANDPRIAFQRADEEPAPPLSPALKRWFGDSKVVDENGDPRVVYHGAWVHGEGDLGDIHAFDRLAAYKKFNRPEGMDAVGSWFSETPHGYNEGRPAGAGLYGGGENGAIYPVYLSIKNPWKPRSFDAFLNVMHRLAGRNPRQQNPKGRGSVGPLREWLEGNGYDGIYFSEALDTKGQSPTWVALHPEQIKSAIGNRGTYDANDPRIAFQRAEEDHAPPFFSALTRAVEASKQQKAHPSQWQGIIDRLPGVKQEEREWSGVREWLAEQKGPVTKEALLDHIRENEIKVGDSLYGEKNAPDPELAAKIREFVQLNEHTPQMTKEQEARHEELYGDLRDDSLIDEDGYPSPRGERVLAGKGISDSPTKYHAHTLPGGKNYREMLLTLPNESADNERLDAQIRELSNWPSDPHTAKRAEDQPTLDKLLQQWDAGEAKSQPFRGGHFDEPNVLAHVRMNDRTGPNGEKILHVEEIQSDWHQKGRKEGYEKQKTEYLLQNKRSGNRSMAFNTRADAERHLLTMPEALRPHLDIVERTSRDAGAVPNAPFKTAWHELALKRALRYAAENGYDKVTWTTGEQQAERYDLSKQVRRIEWTGDGENDRIVTISPTAGNDVEFRVLPNGKVTGISRLGTGTQFDGKQIHDVIGKDIGDKILAERHGTLSGDGLKVGGNGMRGFYDKMLPAAANKIGKPFGAKVGETEIHAGDNRFNYVGPEPRTDEEADAIQRRAARDSATVTGQWDDVMHAVEVGDHTFAEAMSEYGSSRLAEIAGGRMEERPQSATVHSIDITPEMRRHALEQGFPMLQRGEAAAGTGGERITRGLSAERPTTDSWQQGEREIAAGVEALRDKMAPGARIEALRNMRATADTGKEGKVHAAYYRDANLADVVAYALGGPHPDASALHEFVHYFRRAGLLDDKEWSALTAAAEKEGWLTPKLAKRYSMLDRDVQLEEAIAERFPQWLQERADKSKSGFMASLPEVFQRLFYKMDLFRRRVADVARRVLGKDATADDVFTRMETGQVGRRDATGIARNEAFARASREESEAMFSRERDEGENQPPARRVGIIARGSNHITDMLHSAADRALDWGREIQKLATPMAHGDRQADAKDFANAMRLARWDGRWVDNWLKKNFTPEQRTRMFNAAEEESQALQDKRPTEGIGLDRLSGLERDVVEALQARATKAFDQARDLGMHKSPGLPSYVPHMLVQMVDDIAQRMKKKPPSGSPLDPIGRNLSTTTDQLRHRKYKTIEEAEAAARAGGAEGATVVRDIRSLALSTSHLNEAIAGKKLINAIERAGKAAGVETVSIGGIPEGEPTKQWFTIPQHPAFMKYGIKEFVHDPETGGLTPKTDADGKIIFERKPIYVRAEYEGPLRAVLTVPNGPIYNHLMDLKAKTMGLIMYSPLIHNAVEWGRALPAMPGKVLTFRAYFDGNRARNDPETMKRFIGAGLSPIADRGGYQDITSIVNEPNVAPGRSWTAQVLAAVPGLFDPRAGEAVKRAVDKAGDFWHNTLLWDRVADLQMGLAVNMSDHFVKKGLDQQTADRLAAHLANRYAGALPKEAMSNSAQKIANLLAFSRTFTLGNLGAMKDMIVGLPKDVQAQILRDRGLTALDAVQSIAKRKAIATVMLDIGLMYVGNAVLQSAIAVLSGDKTLDEETQGYVRRYQRLLQRGKENPLALLNPFEDLTTLSPLGDNEPNKKDRVRVGAAADGTAVYMRNPVGKIGEEFVGWLTGPLDMVRRKLSTIARPAFQVAANSDSFGHQIYDPYATTPQQWMSNIGKIAMLFIGDQVPLQGIQAARDALAGRGDPNVNAAQVLGPLAGMTFSKGFPGGPATAEKNRIEEQQKYREHEAMPAIRRKIQDGDLDGARKDMADLHMEGWKQKFYLDVTLHPRAHISPKKWQELGRMASPEEFEDLQRMYQQGQH